MTREEASLRMALRTAERRVQEHEEKTQELHQTLVNEMDFWQVASSRAHEKGEDRGGANCSGMASGFALAASRVRTILMGERV